MQAEHLLTALVDPRLRPSRTEARGGRDHGRHGSRSPDQGVNRQALWSEWTKLTTLRSIRILVAVLGLALPVFSVIVAATGSLQDDDTILGASLLGGAVRRRWKARGCQVKHPWIRRYDAAAGVCRIGRTGRRTVVPWYGPFVTIGCHAQRSP